MKAPRNQTLDVRPWLARGGSPLGAVAAAAAALAPGRRLTVIAPFLPSPLIEHLQSLGFAASPHRRADGGWQVDFGRD